MVFSKREHREIRRNFPVTKEYVFFNNAGVAPVCLPAKKAIQSVAEDICKTGYLKLKDLYAGVSKAREETAKLINSSSDEVAFVKNTSHGLSLVAGGIDWRRGDEVIITNQEFPANVYPWLNLKEKGVKIVILKSKKGRLLVNDFKNAINSRTKLVSVSSVEYATGFRNNLKAIGGICRKNGIFFCVDAIQSLGAIPMDVKKYKIDFLAADGHKWLVAPEGIGIFYCRRALLKKIKLVMVGWNTVCDAENFHKINFRLKDNAERFEEGSHNLLGVHALGASIKLLRSIGIEKIDQWNLYLSNLLIERLTGIGCKVLSSKLPEDRSAIVSFTTGSRSKNKLLFNHSIKNKFILSLRGDGIRLSPHLYNTPDEIVKYVKFVDRYL